ncbi:AbrB/MazE/SpoVT family DNA-binding domain-containing protein [Candidatus Woesearchaeota archaeon]|nr:AbrB/MazE/SpoVT family DNA-binding domain-containing protein [Candidatus Woesearchaeota archaeon]
MVEVELKQWGNSIGVILPIEELKEQGLEKGDKVDITIVHKKMMDGFGICKGAFPFEEEKEGHGEFW